ncbi:Zn-ribbon domain-containing protein [Candidatus Altiarchaeota archaeon]
MPHKCVRCGTIYEEGSQELLQGCSCGARVFMYLKQKQGVEKEEVKKELEEKELKKTDVEWIETEFGDKLEKEKRTIHLDVENLRRISEGVFELDIASLMSGKPIVIKAREGVYYIDVPYAMRKKRK